MPKSAAVASAAFASCAWMFAPGPASAAPGDHIGNAVLITNEVTADFAKKQRRLAKGDGVRQDEIIKVSIDAQGEFRLDDNTRLALGPGSRLVLDKFVYDSDKKAGSIVVNLAKGAFRFITGIAAKPTYVINTPNASITVRGTIFDVYILPDNSTWVLLHEGALEATGRKNVCHVLDRPGQLIRISSDGAVSAPMNWSQLPGNSAVAFDTAFPFVLNPPAISPDQTLSRSAIIEAAFPKSPEQACINPHSPTKVRKADTGPRHAAPKKKKKAVHHKPSRKREKTAKRRNNNDDGWGNGVRAMDIIIGGGIGGFGGGRHGGGGRPGGQRHR
jgi:hypothetical protein